MKRWFLLCSALLSFTLFADAVNFTSKPMRKWCHSIEKMVPFYGTVYKSSLYDLIIPFPACESGAEREKRRAVVFASGKTGKSE